MKLGTCPHCHLGIHLDSLIQDEAGRVLLIAMAKMPARMAGAMMEYLALFRPAKSRLTNVRALRLWQETMELPKTMNIPGSIDVLQHALETAVTAARERQQAGSWNRPSDHGWLKAFLKQAKAAQQAPPARTFPTASPRKTGRIPDKKTATEIQAARAALGFNRTNSGDEDRTADIEAERVKAIKFVEKKGVTNEQ